MPDSNARIGADFSGLIRETEKATKALVEMGAKVASLANPLSIATKTLDGMVTTLGRIGLAAQGIEAIGKSTAAMGMELLAGNAKLEMVTISFKTLLGSAAAADAMIKQLTTFAAQTPFNLPGLEASTQRLLAAGYAAQDIVPMMTALGDSISALGGTQDQLNSLVYVFGQMRNEAKLNAGDIMQMSNLGIPALQMLADHYKVTTSDIQDMIHNGLIPGKEAAAIFAEEMEKRYGGMMDAQSKTFSGMISNLQDWATATTIILTKPFFEPAKKALKAFLDYVQSPAGVAIINHMAADIQIGVDKATAAFVRFEPQIKPTLERLLQVANVLRQQMTPGIITLIPLLAQAWTRFEPLALSIWKVYQAIQPVSIAFAVLRGLLTGGVIGAVDAFKDRFALIEGYISKGLELALDAARKYGSQLLDWAMKEAVALEKQILKWGTSLVNWVLPQIPKLLDFLMVLGGNLISWILGEIPVLTRYMLQVATAFVNWVLPIIPRVLFALTTLATQIINWLVAEIPLLTTAMLGWASTLFDWVLPQVPKVLNALGRFGTQVLQWIEKEAPILARDLLYWTEILAGWIIPAIPGVIRALEVVGAAIVNWGVTRLPVLIGDVIVGIGRGFGVNLQRPVNDVLKVFNSLVYNIKTTVLPAFFQMTAYLAISLMPLIDRLAVFISRTLIPTLASLAAFMMTTIVPIFVTAADLLGLIFGPSLVLIGSIIRNELLPALSDSWKFFDGKYMPTVRDLAAALGEKLADGIRLATDKLEAAIPKLDDFYKKIEPIVGKAIDLYKAISPVSIALDVLNGILTGGLQGGLGALEQHMVDLGKVFGLDLQPTIDWFNDTVVKNVIPTLKEWARVFIDEWWPKIRDAVVFVWQKLGDFWTFVSTVIWPPFSDFLAWLGREWGKVGKSIGDTWETTIKPALKEFIHWVAEELWPKLRDDVFPWIEKNVKPKLEAAFSILADTIIPNIGKLIDIVLNHVIPTLFAWWAVLAAFLAPFLKTVGDLIGDITKGLSDQKDPLKGASDGFKTLADILTKDVFPILEKVIGGFHTLWFLMGGWILDPVFKSIGNILKLFGAVGRMVDALKRGDYMGVVKIIQEIEPLLTGQPAADYGQAPSAENGYPSNYRDPTIPSAQHAAGTMSAARGLALVGERGMELIQSLSGKLMLVTQPMLLNLAGGEKVFNNQQTRAMLPNPASPAQISNMYQNSHANSWDSSNHHNTNNWNLNVQQLPRQFQMSEGMEKVWYGKS